MLGNGPRNLLREPFNDSYDVPCPGEQDRTGSVVPRAHPVGKVYPMHRMRCYLPGLTAGCGHTGGVTAVDVTQTFALLIL